MIIDKQGYSYNDVTIIPSVISDISSRSECNPFVNKNDNWLPIFTAPMASVVHFENYETFVDNGIIPIMPRNISLEVRKDLMNDQQWVALSLKEFEDLFINNYLDRIGDYRTHYFIVVDIANGHMKSLYDKCKIAKKNAMAGKYKLTIMTGNIANPDTYEWLCKMNATEIIEFGNDKIIDFIRIGIGGGSGCITTSNVSIHYPQASLIDECYYIKKKYKDIYYPKIVADGGIRNYDHVIKALALGADYVMIGSLFAQCIESAGEKTTKLLSQKIPSRFPIERYKDFSVDTKGNWTAYYNDKGIEEAIKPWKDTMEKDKKDWEETKYPHAKSNYEYSEKKYNEKLEELKEQKILGEINVKFFGMASADGQKSISGEKTKTAEGITKYLLVKYTLVGWVENMISYLRSAMSYTDSRDLDTFRRCTTCTMTY